MPLVPVFTPLGCVTLHLNRRLCGSVCSPAPHEAGEILAGVGRAPRSFPARRGAVGTRTGSRRVCHNPRHFPCDPAGTTPRCCSAVICSKKQQSYRTPAAHCSWARLAGAMSSSSLLQAALSAPVPHAAVDDKLPALKKMQRAYLDAPKGMGCLTFSAAGDTLRHDLLV